MVERPDDLINPAGVNRFDVAALIVALWRLGSDNAQIPTAGGVFDRALADCLTDSPELRSLDLRFGQTSVGLRCYDLPDVLRAASEALLISDSSPTFLFAAVDIDENEARQIVISNGISTDRARVIGSRLVGHASGIARDR